MGHNFAKSCHSVSQTLELFNQLRCCAHASIASLLGKYLGYLMHLDHLILLCFNWQKCFAFKDIF